MVTVVNAPNLGRPSGLSHTLRFQSFPGLFACALECSLSPAGSFAIADQSADTAHKREIIQNPSAAHTASLGVLGRGARTASSAVCEGITLESPDLVAVHSR